MSNYDWPLIERGLQEANAQTFASLIDQAAQRAQADYEVDGLLTDLIENDGTLNPSVRGEALNTQVEVSRWPFLYIIGRNNLLTGNVRDAFVPMLQSGDYSYPPKLSELPLFVVQYLDDVSRHLTSAAAKARLNDLLFCVGQNPQNTSLIAIDSYFELIDSSIDDLEVAEGLLRSIRLSRAVKNDERWAKAMRLTLGFATSKLREASGPGVVLPLLELLAGKHSPYIDETTTLLQEALTVYSDPHIRNDILGTLIKIVDDTSEKADLGRERVRVWLDAARNATNPVRLMHLETAVRIAEDVGDSELRAEARDLLQQAAKGDLGMERFQQQIELPSSVVEEYLSQFTSAADIWDALSRLSTHQPVTGSVDDTRRIAEESDRIAPLQAIIPIARLGADGLPSWRPQTAAEIEDARLARHETLRLQVTADLLARGLMRIRDQYGVPDVEQLVRHFESRPNITPGAARSLSKGFHYFWREDFVEATVVTVWQIEALSRNLLLKANQGIYRTQRESRPGQYPGLGFLLSELLTLGLDESWYRCLWTVFASPAGVNLRNEIAHGFVADIPYTMAAVTLHSASYLSTLGVGTQD
jgi:hypothetical protein